MDTLQSSSHDHYLGAFLTTALENFSGKKYEQEHNKAIRTISNDAPSAENHSIYPLDPRAYLPPAFAEEVVRVCRRAASNIKGVIAGKWRVHYRFAISCSYVRRY